MQPHANDDSLVEIPASASPYAKVLYRKVQSYIEDGNEIEAFNQLVQLMKDSPGDTYAVELSRKIGSRIYTTVAKELPHALSSGNLNRLGQLVSRLRMMADERQLTAIPGYITAAARVDEAERKYWEAMLVSGIAKMKDTADIRDREAMAVSVEKFAASKKLQLSSEHKAAVDRVHADWARHCYLQELRERYTLQENFYADILRRINEKKDLKLCRDDLMRCMDSMPELRELPESAELAQKIAATLSKVRSSIFSQIRRKAIVRSVSVLAISMGVLAVSCVAYALFSASSYEESLRNARVARNLDVVQDMTEGTEPLRFLRVAISSDYEQELETSAAWLAEYRSLCERLKNSEPDLLRAYEQLCKGFHNAEQPLTHLSVIAKVDAMAKELDKKYNRPPSTFVADCLNKCEEKDIAEEVVQYFTSALSQKSVEELVALNDNYLQCLPLLRITEEKENRVRHAFKEAFSAELRRMSAAATTPDAADAVSAKFNEISSKVQLDEELRSSLENYAVNFRKFTNLPQTLCSVRSFAEYIAAIEDCGMCYSPATTGYISTEELHALEGKEETAMRMYKLSSGVTAMPPFADQPDAILPYLKNIRDIYVDGAPLYQSGIVTLSEPMQAVIDELCSDPKRMWRKGLVQLVYNKVLYLGEKQAKGVKRLSYKDGQLYGGILPISKTNPATPCRLADVRSSVGINSKALTNGTITPAVLLMNIARFDDPACPPYARVYLFKRTIELMEQMDEYASGLAFSESLRKDIATFKQLLVSNKNDEVKKEYGCWVCPHNPLNEQPYTDFFASIASHDYCAEIYRSLADITDSSCSFAGFVDAAGKAVRVVEGSAPMHYIENGKFVPFEASAVKPYTPLFVIVPPAGQSNTPEQDAAEECVEVAE